MTVPFEDIKKALENDPEIAVKKVHELLDEVITLPLAIAISGESGAGKSSLVNTLRGVAHWDENAAPTGVVETTRKATKYSHPGFPSIAIWDLPGIGTTNMKSETYVQEMDFQKYDFFLIVSDTRFRENDAKLALAIQEMNKKFYFVRSKIDNDMNSAKMSQKKFDEAETLVTIRVNCIKELENLGVTSPKVFLLSSFYRLKYDFTALVETLEREMSEHQRESLLRAVPSYSLEIIQKKKDVLERKIAGLVAASVFGAVIPFACIAVNDALIKHFVKDCLMTFGLTEKTLELLSKESNVPLTELKAVMKLSVSIDVGLLFAESLLSLVVIFGIPTMMTISGCTTSKHLHKILNTTAEDAQNVLKRAIGLM